MYYFAVTAEKEIAAEVEKAERSKAAVNRGGSGSSQSSVSKCHYAPM